MKFITSFYVFIKLYLMGYSWSGLFDFHEGFYRLNYELGSTKEFAILDIDFNDGVNHPSLNQKHEAPVLRSFSHIHGGTENQTLFRVDGNLITEHSIK